MTRLLLLACSARKRPDDGLLPALERYDGPAFRVVRRYVHDCADSDLRVVVLSARFGLVEALDPVPNYDQVMTREQGQALASQIDRRLAAIDAEVGSAWSDDDCFALLGKQYRDALEKCSSPLARQLICRRAMGGPGVRLTKLHRWLRADFAPATTDALPSRSAREASTAAPSSFKGQAFAITVNDLAQLIDLQNGPLPAAATDSIWKAVVDGRLIAPKWLVSLATGVPASAFTTTEARRFLARLGVETIAP